MKNKSYIGISFIILVFGIIFIPKILDRLSNNDVSRPDRLNANTTDTAAHLLQTIGPVPSFELMSHQGGLMSNKEMLGKVYLVEFFFSTCPTICPIMNKNMLKLEEHFRNDSNFGIISITINPETDTPQVLKAHAEHLGVSHKNWHFLSGDRESIFDLSNKGFNLYTGINPDVDGGFEHSGLFALVDKKGNIRSRKDDHGNPIVYYDGLEESGILALKQDIRVLLNE